MADILRSDRSSRENLDSFIDSIEEDLVGDLLRVELDHIIAVGRLERDNSTYEQHREAFFNAVEQLIAQRMENHEN